jgi:hypothetical protein
VLRNWPITRARAWMVSGALFPLSVGLFHYLGLITTPDVRFFEHVAYTNLTAVGFLALFLALTSADISWRPVARLSVMVGLLLWSAGNDLFIILRLTVQSSSAPWVMPLPVLPLLLAGPGMIALSYHLQDKGFTQVRWVRLGFLLGFSILSLSCVYIFWQGKSENYFQRHELKRHALVRRCPTTPERTCCVNEDCQKMATCPTLVTECFGQNSLGYCYEVKWSTSFSNNSFKPLCEHCLAHGAMIRESRNCE